MAFTRGMKRILLVAAGAALCAGAQTNDVVETAPLISVTALRLPETVGATPAMVSVLAAEDVRERSVRNLPDALREESGVMVQKTSPGQGSPYIRGFTGYRTLLLVDGIRLNTSIMRDGPNQYWNTVDAFGISSLELLQGPASVLYGSDAIGGVAQAFSAMPEFAEPVAFRTGGSVFMRGASAEHSLVTRLTGELAEDNWAALLGVTRKHFGDIRAGGSTGRQPKTGYDEWAFDAKFRVKLAGDRELILAHQQVDQDNVWRTHRTIYGISWKGTTIGNEWRHIYDQNRTLSYARLIDREPTALYDQMNLTLFFGWQSELQFIQNPAGAKAKDSSRAGFDVYTPGVNLEFQNETSLGTLVWGGEYSRDIVRSWRNYYNSNTGRLISRDIQGIIADDSTYDLLGLFIQHRFRFLDERLEITPGLRATLAHADIGAYDDLTQTTPAASSFSDTWYNLSGNLRAAYWLTESRDFMLYSGVGQAFRAPNLSDLTSLNATRTSSYSVPSTDLDPERFITAEVGTKWDGKRGSVNLAFFHTWIRGMMNSVDIEPPPGARDPAGKHYTQRENGTRGHVHGVELSGRLNLTETLQLRSAFTWMEGRSDSHDTREPHRTMPLTASTALRWTAPSKRFWIETAALAADREDRLTSSDKTDTSRIPPNGTPGYLTCALRAGFNPAQNLSFTASCENVFDTGYRVHGSGSNEPGRNFVLTAKYAF